MLRVGFQTLRFRTAGFVASFVVLMLGATVVMACGGLMESGIRTAVLPQRLGAPPLVVTGSQSYRDATLPERARLDSRLIARLRGLPGVARVVPDVSFPVAMVRDHRPFAIGGRPAGHGWSSAQLTPFHLREGGSAPRGPREVVFDTALAARTGTRVGDRVELVVRGRAERFRVVGLASAPSGASSSVFFFDRATPTLLAKRGAVDSIGIFATRGVSIGRLQRRIEKALPARTTKTLRGDERGLAENPEAEGQAADLVALSGVFGGLAVMVAVFVVASTLGLSLQLRRRELALLRAIGTTPRQLRRLVCGEAILLAVPATVLAYLPSARLGHWLLARFAESGVVSPALRYEQGWIPTVSGAAIGVITAVGAALIAARGATRVRPVEALAEASLEQRWLSPLRLLFALLCLAGGLALTIVTALVLAGPVAASTAAPSAMLWAAGLALLGPGIARVLAALVSWPVRALSGLAGELAMLNAGANRIRTAGALTPLMLATGLTTALLYMQTSQTSAAVHAYTDNLRADVVLSSPTGGLPLELTRIVRKQPGVAGASALVTSTGFFEQPGESAASVPVQGIDAAGAAETTGFDLTAGTLARLRGTTVALAARDARPGRRLGDTVRMRLGDGTVLGLKVVALFGAERGYESALLPARLLAPHTTNGLANQILVRAAPGANEGRLRARLARLSRMYPGLRVADRTRATADYTSNQQISAWANYLLVAVIVGYTLISLVNALVIATAARRREFALQRLIGSTRAQIARMMTIEGLFLATAGTALGTLIAAATLIPFNIALKGAPTPAGPTWIYVTAVVAATALTLLATLLPTALALRAHPAEAAAVLV
jgi:putative ABC transport system permease protein